MKANIRLGMGALGLAVFALTGCETVEETPTVTTTTTQTTESTEVRRPSPAVTTERRVIVEE